MGTENLRKFFGDDRIHVIAGRVEAPAGAASHFYINEENNVVISVKTHHHEMQAWANLSNTPGVWTIPDVGTEVMLASDNGDIEGEVYVVGIYGATNVPNASTPTGHGPQKFNIAVTGEANIIVGPGGVVRFMSDTMVEAASAPGSGVSLAVQEALHDIWSYLRKQFDPALGHVHKAVVPAAPTSIVEGTSEGLPGSLILASIEPNGTTILKGE